MSASTASYSVLPASLGAGIRLPAKQISPERTQGIKTNFSVLQYQLFVLTVLDNNNLVNLPISILTNSTIKNSPPLTVLDSHRPPTLTA
jgi:hypothetical protein